jgi:hypothetical protein
MGEVIPFPELHRPSIIDRLKRDQCLVRFTITVEPDLAVELMVALGYLNTPLTPETVEIIIPTQGDG